MVVQALEEQGYALQSADYREDNPISDYHAILQDIEGCEVEIVVSPKDNTLVHQDLSIISYDREQKSEHEMRQRAKEIARSLQKQGLSVSSFQVLTNSNPKLSEESLSQDELRSVSI
jgi:hypothetical protein